MCVCLGALFGHQCVCLLSNAVSLGASIETLSGEGGGIPSSIKQPLLSKFWPPDDNKKHSSYPFFNVFVDALGLVINASVSLLQLSI